MFTIVKEKKMPGTMKMVMIVYNEAVDGDVAEVLKKCGAKNYTKILAAYGKGNTSGTHMGNDIWPGRNNVLYIACLENEAQSLMTCVKTLRKRIGKEGIKAFLLPLEGLTE